MLFLRSLAYGVVQVVTVIPYALTCLVLMLFLPLHLRYRFTVLWPRFIIWAGAIVCDMRYRVEGYENLPDGPCILLPKHQSAWETLYFPGYMPREVCFVYKRELHYLPFFGWALAALRMVHIDRSRGQDAFEHVVEQGTQRMAEGRWIIMFPEGTRTAVGKKGRYKTGGTRLACRLKVPVVPIAVNAGDCWPRNSFIKKPGLITVSIGKPIPSDTTTPEQLLLKVESWIESEMRRISPHAYADEASKT
jgi:1-acyl-sn-glycerol-3-phosphate acyltransferase